MSRVRYQLFTEDRGVTRLDPMNYYEVDNLPTSTADYLAGAQLEEVRVKWNTGGGIIYYLPYEYHCDFCGEYPGACPQDRKCDAEIDYDLELAEEEANTRGAGDIW